MELRICVDLATVDAVLKVVLSDIGVDFASDVGPSHLTTFGFLEEVGEFVADPRGFDKAAGLSVCPDLLASLSAAESADLLHETLFEIFELVLECGGLCAEVLELGAEFNAGCG